jgi:PAS domain S-box-containing protein
MSNATVNPGRRATRALGLATVVIGAAVWVGWLVPIDVLRRFVPGAATMKPNTALAALLGGIALTLALSRRSKRLSTVLFALVALIGGLHLLEDVARVDLGIDQLLLRDEPGAAQTGAPGRMAPATALGLLVIGAGGALRNVRSARTIIQVAAAAILLLAVHGAFGYAFDRPAFYRFGEATAIALPTAAVLLTLSVGLWFATPGVGIGAALLEQTPAGAQLRLLLPTVLFGPLLLGWLAAEGDRRDILSKPLADTFLTTGVTALLAVIVARTNLTMRRLDSGRRQALEELAEREQIFRTSFENAFAGIALLDGSLRWLRFNDALCEIFELGRAGLIERPLMSLFHPDDSGKVLTAVDELRSGAGAVELDVRAAGARGKPLWLEIRIAAERSSTGDVMHFVLVAADVSARKRSAELLRTHERAIHAATIGIFIADVRLPGMPVVAINPAFEEMTGLGEDDVLGTPFLSLHETSATADQLTRIRESLDRREACSATLHSVRADGSRFWSQLTLSPVTDEAETLTHVVGIQQDITDRVEAADERERLLAQALADRRVAELATQARDQLLAVVSHELRSPLNAVRLWASLLLADADSGVDRGTVERAARQIERSVDAQSRLIDDLLDVSRIASGKLELEREPLEFNALAKESVEGMRPACEQKRIRLTFHPLDEPCVVRADRTRMDQVVRNLMENAIKFTPEGGSIEVSMRCESDEVVVSVQDSGRGLDDAELAHVFDRFWQADPGDTRAHGGLGLGLSIVRHLVYRHGGSVTASSPGRGQGATLTFRLPTVAHLEAVGLDRSPRSTAPVDVGVEGDVLVVDDDATTAEALALALRVRGIQTRTAHDADTALSRIADKRPLVLISDLMMSGRTGFDLIETVRSDEESSGQPRIHAIAITGRGNPADRRRSHRAGFDGFMPKPIDVGALVKAVQGILEGGPQQPAARQRVLVVEDRRIHDDSFGQQLGRAGHDVRVAHDLATAQEQVEAFSPQVLIADMEVLGKDHEELWETIRTDHVSMFVVAITPSPTGPGNLEHFDYVLTKPVQFEELSSALRRLHRL